MRRDSIVQQTRLRPMHLVWKERFQVHKSSENLVDEVEVEECSEETIEVEEEEGTQRSDTRIVTMNKEPTKVAFNAITSRSTSIFKQTTGLRKSL